MIFQSQTAPAPAAQSSYRPLSRPLLQRKCACGGTPGPSGECAECAKKENNQRKSIIRVRRALVFHGRTFDRTTETRDWRK